VQRRALGLAALGSLFLAGCDRIGSAPAAIDVLRLATRLSHWMQALLAPQGALAPEYPAAAISPAFRGNGTVDPDDDDYQDLAANNFADWRLTVDGLVRHPAKFSLAQLQAMPSRTQITRHDCVEGWSCIGQWTGVPLAHILEQVMPLPQARYLVFHCADSMENNNPDTRYYESIDMHAAVHPQTILAYGMNGQPLPVAHGAPLRLRVERQLGYKMAKYVMRIEAVESFAQLRGGRGGYWEDLGYEWYAGI
jgi:DMSO/TMAO reductase YedYZ molybdopterin-dependent catalytic subunit